MEVLHGGLKNDTTPEAFPICHVNNAQVCFPTRYVKIVPLSYAAAPVLINTANTHGFNFNRAHGQNFHTSIWHISMTGIADKKYVDHIYRIHEEVRPGLDCRFVPLVYQKLPAPRKHRTPSHPQTPKTTPSPHPIPGHSLTGFHNHRTSLNHPTSYNSGPARCIQGGREAPQDSFLFWPLLVLPPVFTSLCGMEQDNRNR